MWPTCPVFGHFLRLTLPLNPWWTFCADLEWCWRWGWMWMVGVYGILALGVWGWIDGGKQW